MLLPNRAMSKWSVLWCITVALFGCGGGVPRDPDRTTQRMRGGVMQVGVSHDPPFVVVPPTGAPTGSDVARMQAFAQAQGARIAWMRGSHDGLMHDLTERRLQAVVGGMDATSPWRDEVGATRPFDALDARGRTVQRVIAVPPGENAWLMRLEAHLHPDAAR